MQTSIFTKNKKRNYEKNKKFRKKFYDKKFRKEKGKKLVKNPVISEKNVESWRKGELVYEHYIIEPHSNSKTLKNNNNGMQSQNI